MSTERVVKEKGKEDGEVLVIEQEQASAHILTVFALRVRPRGSEATWLVSLSAQAAPDAWPEYEKRFRDVVKSFKLIYPGRADNTKNSKPPAAQSNKSSEYIKSTEARPRPPARHRAACGGAHGCFPVGVVVRRPRTKSWARSSRISRRLRASTSSSADERERGWQSTGAGGRAGPAGIYYSPNKRANSTLQHRDCSSTRIRTLVKEIRRAAPFQERSRAGGHEVADEVGHLGE